MDQSSTGSWGVSSARRLIVITGHSACFEQNSLTVPTKTLQKRVRKRDNATDVSLPTQNEIGVSKDYKFIK